MEVKKQNEHGNDEDEKFNEEVNKFIIKFWQDYGLLVEKLTSEFTKKRERLLKKFNGNIPKGMIIEIKIPIKGNLVLEKEGGLIIFNSNRDWLQGWDVEVKRGRKNVIYNFTKRY